MQIKNIIFKYFDSYRNFQNVIFSFMNIRFIFHLLHFK